VKRDWLAYSQSTGDVFCVPCLVFGRQESQSAFRTGFSDWKHAPNRAVEHESNTDHKSAIIAWSSRSITARRIDCELVKHIETERKYWRDVLLRVVETIKFLSERGLAFRGDDETFGSLTNGNYMGILELICKFDPFLLQHVEKYGGAGKGVTSYLSKTICDELIEHIGRKVVCDIVAEIKAAKYYSISVDSTPDIFHIDQLTFIIRYVAKNGRPVERFIKFVEIHGHGAANLAEVVTAVIDDIGLNIVDCRGQSYDNASNMAGIYTGLQARIKAINPLAHFVPCAAHSLNLVGACAAECCVNAVSFFGFVQTLYNFFSASTYRWKMLKNSLPRGSLVVKSLSGTRWSARADATKALFDHFQEISSALIRISADDNQSTDTRTEAARLEDKMNELEIGLMVVIWHEILDRFNATSLSLQQVEIDLLSVVKLYESLRIFVSQMRDRFDEIEEKAKSMVIYDEYREIGKRKKRRRRFFDEEDTGTSDIQLLPRDKFRVDTFITILDSLDVELNKRLSSYTYLHGLFGFLTEFESLSLHDLRRRAENLVECYSDDIEASFVEEFVQFVSIMRDEEDKSIRHMSELLKVDGGLFRASFPNVEIVLRIYLTIPINNCEGERSF
jgi:hypothetical protein